MIVDITDKLNFEESPKLKIKNVTVEVNADAPTMLKVMQRLGNGVCVTHGPLHRLHAGVAVLLHLIDIQADGIGADVDNSVHASSPLWLRSARKRDRII